MKIEISQQNFEKKLNYQVSSKSVQWEPSCFMRTDKLTDTKKLIVAFRNFAKASTKEAKLYCLCDVFVCDHHVRAVKCAQ